MEILPKNIFAFGSKYVFLDTVTILSGFHCAKIMADNRIDSRAG